VGREASSGDVEDRPRQPYRMRLPGFLHEDREAGLGDVIKSATSLAGIKPCAGCARRAEALNRVLAFTATRRSNH
jgi:hypothetical protein